MTRVIELRHRSRVDDFVVGGVVIRVADPLRGGLLGRRLARRGLPLLSSRFCVVEGAGRFTGAFGLGASPRTPPAPAVPRAPRGCFWMACVVLHHNLAYAGRRPAGHPSGCWIPFFPSLLSIDALGGAHRRRTRRYGLACGRRLLSGNCSHFACAD